MALLALLNDNYLLITGNREILFLDIEANEIKHKLLLPEPQIVDKAKNGAEPNGADEELAGDNEDETGKLEKSDDAPQSAISKIHQIALSPQGNQLAVTTSGDKLLYLYRIDNSCTELISKRELSRVSSAIRFAPTSASLLVSDKTGDCYIYDCSAEPDSPGKWLLGHFSMILDVMFTNDERNIITCDRDEKIRLTNYPGSHTIETYCLGHTEYVSSIALLPSHPNEILLSISGDARLKLWNYIVGEEIAEFKLPAAALKMAVKHSEAGSTFVAILFVDYPDIVIYELVPTNDSNRFACKQEYHFPNSNNIWSLLFTKSGDLLLSSTTNEDNRILLEKIPFSGAFNADNKPAEQLTLWNDLVASNLSEPIVISTDTNEDTSILFKKRFDNIHNYHERKKRRIEEKNKR